MALEREAAVLTVDPSAGAVRLRVMESFREIAAFDAVAQFVVTRIAAGAISGPNSGLGRVEIDQVFPQRTAAAEA